MNDLGGETAVSTQQQALVDLALRGNCWTPSMRGGASARTQRICDLHKKGVTYLRFPQAHHRRIRTTNRIERLAGEGRRRTKVIRRFPTERLCLTLLDATLITGLRRWRRVPMTPVMVKLGFASRHTARPLTS